MRTQRPIVIVSSEPNPRWAKMTNDQVRAEYARYGADLDRLTGGRGDEVYLKANSFRAAWTELIRRGLMKP